MNQEDCRSSFGTEIEMQKLEEVKVEIPYHIGPLNYVTQLLNVEWCLFEHIIQSLCNALIFFWYPFVTTSLSIYHSSIKCRFLLTLVDMFIVLPPLTFICGLLHIHCIVVHRAGWSANFSNAEIYFRGIMSVLKAVRSVGCGKVYLFKDYAAESWFLDGIYHLTLFCILDSWKESLTCTDLKLVAFFGYDR